MAFVMTGVEYTVEEVLGKDWISGCITFLTAIHINSYGKPTNTNLCFNITLLKLLTIRAMREVVLKMGASNSPSVPKITIMWIVCNL